MAIYALDLQGSAENGLIEGIAGIHGARPSLWQLALTGHPGALTAYRYSRRAERCLLAANRALNPSNDEAA